MDHRHRGPNKKPLQSSGETSYQAQLLQQPNLWQGTTLANRIHVSTHSCWIIYVNAVFDC